MNVRKIHVISIQQTFTCTSSTQNFVYCTIQESWERDGLGHDLVDTRISRDTSLQT